MEQFINQTSYSEEDARFDWKPTKPEKKWRGVSARSRVNDESAGSVEDALETFKGGIGKMKVKGAAIIKSGEN